MSASTVTMIVVAIIPGCLLPSPGAGGGALFGLAELGIAVNGCFLGSTFTEPSQ